MSIVTKIFGDPNARYLKKLQPIVEKINGLESDLEKLSDTQLRAKTEEFKQLINQGKTLEDILGEAFAAVREAAKRTLGQRHFDVQLMGGIVLHRGEIAEMKTGEGKTLAATLPVYLNALTGKGVHIVTVNDYLARRDTVWMGQIYHALGLSVSCIQHENAFVYDESYGASAHQKKSEIQNSKSLTPLEKNSLTGQANSSDQNSKPKIDKSLDKERDIKGAFKIIEDYLCPLSRKEAYAADITYGTNNEFGFDYLRDNLAANLDDMVQRGFNFAIVDEVDSILIDEARTPLIISAPAEEPTEMYYKFAALVRRLRENEDYNVDEKMRAATLSEAGIDKMEKWLGIENLYAEGGIEMVHHIEQALKAHALFARDKDYVVREGQVIIVDEFTGRLMPGRRYSEGLHQAIEAKEGVTIERESRTLATVTFQNYFRLYEKLAGMTGTALTEAEEFSKIYGLEVACVPTNKPMIRQDKTDRIYKNEEAKFRAVASDVKERHERGQPVLVGTISIEKNEILGRMLEQEGIRANILNAKNHEREAEIIAQAGKFRAVTVATNMAGRGVDIVLGGNPPNAEEAQKVKGLGGLHVLGTERHESRRIDNQLRGRSGRQGDHGSSQFYVSLEDDLMRIFAGDRVKRIMERLGVPEDMPIENRMVSRALEAAQKKVEDHNFDIRKHLLEYDDVLNKHREAIYRRRREILEIYKIHKEKALQLRSEQAPSEETGRASLRDKILELVEKEIEQVVFFHTSSSDEKEWNIEEIYEVANTIFPVPTDLRVKLKEIEEREAGGKAEDAAARTKIIEELMGFARRAYDELEERTKRELAGVGEEEGSIAIEPMREVEKGVMLRAIDTLWTEHLSAMDHLRAGIGLRGYGQRDPLVEYKREAYRMFAGLLAVIDKQIVYSIYKVGAAIQMAPSLMQKPGVKFIAPAKTMTSGGASERKNQRTPIPLRRDVGGYGGMADKERGKKVGRNDPCPCGATKADGTPIKYKRCHGE